MAFEGDATLGFTLLYHHWTTVALGHVWLLNDSFTRSDARQKGGGEALLNHATDFGKADGAKRIWLRTAVDNFTGQKLYEKVGYRRDEQFYRYALAF
ncbi:MAG: GNAT family N-acetyltransferase [Trueperaceae bacterium]